MLAVYKCAYLDMFVWSVSTYVNDMPYVKSVATQEQSKCLNNHNGIHDVLVVVTGDNSIVRLTMCISNNVLYIS